MEQKKKPDSKKFNAGDIVYFKKCKRATSKASLEVEFKGHGFGVLFGAVPPGMPEPTPNDIFPIFGTIGFLSFDDVAEFLGDEQGALCVKKFEDKYYARLPNTEEVKLIDNPVVGLDGKPLVQETTENV